MKTEEEKKRNKIIYYRGTPLVRYEYDVLMVLDNEIGKIPQVSGKSPYNFVGMVPSRVDNYGITAQDNHIVQLNLISLSESTGPLTSLPESIGSLTELQFLDLKDIELISLPESIGSLSSLQFLGLDYNQLTSLMRHSKALVYS